MFSARWSSWSKAQRQAAAVLALLAALAVAWYGGRIALGIYSWRQKVTMEVEGPTGMAAGSAVQAVEWRRNVFYVIAHDGATEFSEVHGEATAVDLGEGRHLFALLGNAATIAMAARGPLSDGGDLLARAAGVEFGDHRPKPVPRRYYPLLVTFDDIADPKTVKRVDPDDLDVAFGLCPDGSGLKDADAPWRAEKMTWLSWSRWKASHLWIEEYRRRYEQGYVPPGAMKKLDAEIVPRDRSGDCRRLAAITLEITSEPVTEGKVESVLGWFNDGKTAKSVWSELSSEQHDMLSTYNWKRGS